MAKTKKQVISGYHRPVCNNCKRELRPEKNGVGVLDMAEGREYELYDADLWKCPGCGLEVVGGFAFKPCSAHYDDDFEKQIAAYRDRGLLIVNNG